MLSTQGQGADQRTEIAEGLGASYQDVCEQIRKDEITQGLINTVENLLSQQRTKVAERSKCDRTSSWTTTAPMKVRFSGKSSTQELQEYWMRSITDEFPCLKIQLISSCSSISGVDTGYSSRLIKGLGNHLSYA